MGAGKILCILGGIITLLATYLFSFAVLIPGFASLYGIGFFMNFEIFFSGIPATAIEIIMIIVFVIFMLSGVFILVGLKVRALAIFGGIFATVIGLYLILTTYNLLPPEIGQYILFFARADLVGGIIPLSVDLGGPALGSFLVLGGGVLGLVGGIMGTEDF
jgi:hypothetical protein